MRLLLIILIGIDFFAVGANGKTNPISMQTIELEFTSTFVDNLSGEEQRVSHEKLLQFCQVIGGSLVFESGPMGFGVFDNYRCSVKQQEKSKLPWKVVFAQKNEHITLSVSYRNRNLCSHKLEGGELFIQVLKDEDELLDIVSMLILECLPAVAKINPKRRRGIEGDPLDGFKLPSSLKAFTLEDQGGVFKAKIISRLSQVEDESAWKLDSTAYNNELFVNFESDAQKSSQDLVLKFNSVMTQTDTLNAIKGQFVDRLVEKGVFGLRYGYGLEESSVFAKSSGFYGVYIDTVEGFRISADIWPQTVKTINDQISSFASQRFTFAKAYVVTLPIVDVDLHLLPKIGFWGFTFDIPVKTNDVDQVVRFQVENGIGLGLRIRTAIPMDWLTLYPFVELGYSLGLGQKDASVNSQVGGGDLMIKLSSFRFDRKSYYVTLLAFGLVENFNFVSKQKVSELRNDEVIIEQVQVSQFYLGGGIVLAW